ncbi:hypothetical protein F4677DRAFT_446238 [Hypoxylon crocopeplum]|nr:hypothetical protein F4677DRAFT_446238 [Hypoxylon crocopeplum]
MAVNIWGTKEYRHIWLKKLHVQDRLTAYSLDITHIVEKYTEFDDAPLICWLFHLLCYGHLEQVIPFSRYGSGFTLNSFWSQQRREVYEKPLVPSLSYLKAEAANRILTVLEYE